MNLPEMQVTPEEAHEFLRLSNDALKHFEVPTWMSEKNQDIMAAAGFGAAMYWNRVLMLMARKSREARGQVIPFPQPQRPMQPAAADAHDGGQAPGFAQAEPAVPFADILDAGDGAGLAS